MARIFGRMVGFLEWLTGKHKCECGAVYRVTKTKTPFPDREVVCEHCGKVMDRWRQSPSFRSYDLISRPGTDEE
jgi:predicted Zn finger-like uncharacterized protein